MKRTDKNLCDICTVKHYLNVLLEYTGVFFVGVNDWRVLHFGMSGVKSSNVKCRIL